MRILLASNSPYYPSHGGGNKSNRLLVDALAVRGHEVHVVTRVAQFGAAAHKRVLAELTERGIPADTTDPRAARIRLGNSEVFILTRDSSVRTYLADRIVRFDPDVILTSTDDPAHLMLQVALRAARARVVYLVRATVALPFGPDAALESHAKTPALRHVDGAVGVSEYVADYARRWGGLDAVHVPISLLEPDHYPDLGRFDNRFVTIVNPCGVKGISIFLALAECFPQAEFAAVPTWGTTQADRSALERVPNVTVLAPVDDIDKVLRQTRVLLVPSIWAEARSRMILEGMSRGIPVLASDVGGLREAKLGVDYVLPVNPVTNYRAAVDELMVPSAEIPKQDIGPWERALGRLLRDRRHYEELSIESRRAALAYAEGLTAAPFEAYLERLLRAPKRWHSGRHVLAAQPADEQMSPDRKKLLSLRLKRKADDRAQGPE